MSAKVYRCFHCEEVFTTRASAAEHFGSGDYEENPPAMCVDPLRKDEKERLKQLRDAEEYAHKCQREAEEVQVDADLYHSYREEIGRLFGMVGGVKASTPHQAWLVLDSARGEILSLKEKLTEATK